MMLRNRQLPNVVFSTGQMSQNSVMNTCNSQTYTDTRSIYSSAWAGKNVRSSVESNNGSPNVSEVRERYNHMSPNTIPKSTGDPTYYRSKSVAMQNSNSLNTLRPSLSDSVLNHSVKEQELSELRRRVRELEAQMSNETQMREGDKDFPIVHQKTADETQKVIQNHSFTPLTTEAQNRSLSGTYAQMRETTFPAPGSYGYEGVSSLPVQVPYAQVQEATLPASGSYGQVHGQGLYAQTDSSLFPVSGSYAQVRGESLPVPVPCQSAYDQNTATPYQSSHQSWSRPSNTSVADNYKSRLPYFNGKGDWKSFMMQFQFLTERYQWNPRRQVEELLLCLKDDALVFASQLPPDVCYSISQLSSAMECRFGEKYLPETYRRELNVLKRKNDESLQEYSSRVEGIVRKAYPGIENSELYRKLSIEHMLYGLNDQSITYDVLTKMPKTMDEAVNLVTWHESCKSGLKGKHTIRHVSAETSTFEDVYDNDVEIRRLGGKRFVTEERLIQFGRDLKESISRDVIQNLSDVIDRKLSYGNSQRGPNHVTCYSCKEEGHISRNCPLRGEDKSGDQGKKSFLNM